MMFDADLLVIPLLIGAGMLLCYVVIRLAVKHGTVDAQRRLESDRVRERDHLGPERSPNSRP
jgi:hypothetical protein